MLLGDLKTGCKLNVVCNTGASKSCYQVSVLCGYTRNSVVITPITELFSYSSLEDFKISIEYPLVDNRALIFEDASIVSIIKNGRNLHVLSSEEDVKPTNRRESVRVNLSAPCDLTHVTKGFSTSCFLSDISMVGAGVKVRGSADYAVGDIVQLIFDYDSMSYRLHGIVVRRKEEESDILFIGVKLLQTPNNIGSLIARVQREELKRRQGR